MPTSGARPVLAFDSPQFVAHRRRFARLRYIVWGCAGYQGNCDIDYDLVSPVGFSNRQEARQCAAAMTAACEDHCDRSAEIINETPGYEWDGAESYYVATLTLPSALNWDGGDAFGALKTSSGVAWTTRRRRVNSMSPRGGIAGMGLVAPGAAATRSHPTTLIRSLRISELRSVVGHVTVRTIDRSETPTVE